MNDETIIQVNNLYRLQWEEAQQCYVLLYPEGMIQLNPSAGEILSRADGQRTAADIIADLQQQFPDAPPTAIKDDVHEFLEVAKTNGWII